MSRNRVIYQSNAVFVGPTPATGDHFSSGNSGANEVVQLHRIQSANYGFNVTRQDVNQFGNLAAISREIVDSPTVSLDFSYYVANALNESRLGFTVDGTVSAISGILNQTQDEKNYFILTSPVGTDAAGYAGEAGTNGVVGIGNGFIRSYSTEGRVGSLATANVSVEGLNIKFDAGSTGNNIPAVNPTDGSGITEWQFSLPQAVSGVAGMAAAIRPGDITVTVVRDTDNDGTGIGINFNELKIQSYTLSYDLTREALSKLGSKFAFSKEIQFPVTVTASIEANVGDFGSGNLADLLCKDDTYTISINLRRSVCSGVGDLAIQYQLKGAKLDSENFSNSIGANEAVTMQWSTQIGAAENQTVGLFVSGILN